jgi:acetyl esterase/lipase
VTPSTVDDGRMRFLGLLDQLPLADPRIDIDTASLVARFPALAGVEVTELQLTGPHGVIPARRYLGDTRSGRGLVWVHGGAFVAGDLDMPESHWVSMELASRGIPVLALDYSKALDGVHHPVPSDEVLAGWLAAVTDGALGVPVEHLHLGGASAGANLVAGVTARLARDGQPRPASLILVYPVLHGVLPPAEAAAAAAAESIPEELRFTPEFLRAVNLNYVGDEALLYDAVAFPANATVHGFPPTLLVNAEADDLRPSGEAFAAQLERAGVATTAVFEPGTVHGYLDQPGLPAAFATIGRMAAWVVGERPTG